jgi:hypothetical protein
VDDGSKDASMVVLSDHEQVANSDLENTSIIEQSKEVVVIPPKSVAESKVMISFEPSEVNLEEVKTGVGGSSPSANTLIELPRVYIISYSSEDGPILSICTSIVDAFFDNFTVDELREKNDRGTIADSESKLNVAGNIVLEPDLLPLSSSSCNDI